MIWKKLGKEGMAVKAPWPVAGEEDKILTRQAQFLRITLKQFRGSVGKAKKGSFEKASILIRDGYPQWKVDVLKFLQEEYIEGSGFPPTLMSDLKKWASTNIEEKKLMKNAMQFASFVKKEVEEVGTMAMDIQLPYDQQAILNEAKRYFEVQLNVPEIDTINMDEDTEAAAAVPEKKADIATPGKPHLWLH